MARLFERVAQRQLLDEGTNTVYFDIVGVVKVVAEVVL